MSINEMMLNPKHFEVLKAGIKEIQTRSGHILEFGVGTGNSFRRLCGLSHPRKVFGFDSFEGLPENWAITKHVIFAAGSFKYNPPRTPDNGELVIGWFEDTIPVWKQKYEGNIAFIHVDSDLYSSCRTILTLLNDRIVPGTIIAFDEMYHYDNWQEGEYKAHKEWCEEYQRKTHEITVNRNQAMHRVIV